MVLLDLAVITGVSTSISLLVLDLYLNQNIGPSLMKKLEKEKKPTMENKEQCYWGTAILQLY